MAVRTLASVVAAFPDNLSRVALHVGEQRNPPHILDLLAADYRLEDGALNRELLEAHIAERAAGAGYGTDHPSYQIRIFREGHKTAVDTFQETPKTSAPKSDTAALMAGFLSMANILKDICKEQQETIRFQAEKQAATMDHVHAIRSELGEVAAELALKDAAIEEGKVDADNELKVRAVDMLEKVGTAALQKKAGGVSAKGLHAIIKGQPENARKLLGALKAELRKDPTSLALVMEELGK